jgi:hypothetical protein
MGEEAEFASKHQLQDPEEPDYDNFEEDAGDDADSDAEQKNYYTEKGRNLHFKELLFCT